MAVAKKAKEIVKKWKEDVVSSPQAASSAKGASPVSSAPKDVERKSGRCLSAMNWKAGCNRNMTNLLYPASLPNSTTPSAASSLSSSPKTPSDAPVVRTVKSDEMRVKPTGNTPRDKTIEMMYSAIGLGSFVGM